MEHVQLDVEVVFEYPDVSNVEFTDEAKLDDAFNCSQGGYEHRGVFGPFGLLVLTDENFQEQTAVYFYIACSTDGKWTTRFCNDQSRYDKSLRKDTSYYLFVSENVKILAAKCNVSILATKCYFEIEDKKIDLGIGIVQIIFATWC
jgi:hypothetical protein